MKKTISLVLALLLFITASFALTSCGGDSISAENWQAAFGGRNFVFDTFTGDAVSIIMYEGGYCYSELTNVGTEDEPSYDYDTEELYSKTEDGTTTYYKTVYRTDDTVVEITEADFEFSREDFAPILDFVRDNQSLFKSSRFPSTFYYEGELPGEVKAWIDSWVETPADFYSIVVDGDYQNGEVDRLLVYSDSTIAEREEEAINNGHSEIEADIIFGGFGDQFCYPLYCESLESLDNFSVIGGEGENYMELYFDGDNFRLYTPTVAEGEYSEAIFAVVDGAYKYFKRVEGGEWEVETLGRDAYMSRLSEFRKLFGGEPLFDSNNPFTTEIDDNKFVADEWAQVYSGKSGFFDLYYTKIEISFDNNYYVVGAAWNIKMQQVNLGDAVVDAGRYVMTVGGVEVTAPN